MIAEFSFFLIGCLMEAKMPSLPYYLLVAKVAEEQKDLLVRNETQEDSSRIWTWFVEPIS